MSKRLGFSPVDMLLVPSDEILGVQAGYDLIAPTYEQWRWVTFWHLNEAPIVRRWLETRPIGLGLDAGSGTGPYVRHMIEFGHRCIAMDFSWRMLEENREITSACNMRGWVDYTQADITNCPFKAETFDWVLCSRVLSHVPNISRVLAEFSVILKRGGECLIADVHPDHPYTTVAIPLNRAKIRIDTYKHTVKEIRELVQRLNEFELISLEEYYWKDLMWQPPRETFSKLYEYVNPAIFYVVHLRKH